MNSPETLKSELQTEALGTLRAMLKELADGEERVVVVASVRGRRAEVRLSKKGGRVCAEVEGVVALPEGLPALLRQVFKVSDLLFIPLWVETVDAAAKEPLQQKGEKPNRNTTEDRDFAGEFLALAPAKETDDMSVKLRRRAAMSAWKKMSMPLEKGRVYVRELGETRAIVSEIFSGEAGYTEQRARTIAVFLARSSSLFGLNSKETITEARGVRTALMWELALANQNETRIRTLADFYRFAKEKCNCSPTAAYLVLKLEGRNERGVRALADRGHLAAPPLVSLDSAGEDGEPIHERIADPTADAAFQNSDRRMVLEKILATNGFTDTEERILRRIIEGEDVEDAEYAAVADAVRRRPDLMELLG